MYVGELTWTEVAPVLRPVPTSAPLAPGPALIAGVSPLPHPQDNTEGGAGAQPKALWVSGIQVCISFDLGEGGWCA